MHDEVIRILSRAQVNANRTGHSFPAETLDVPLQRGRTEIDPLVPVTTQSGNPRSRE